MAFRTKATCLRSIALHVLLFCNGFISAQYSDTIYFNRNWQITEKPFSNFFRVGSVVYGNPYIIYMGKVTDHYADGSLMMEGSYSDEGLKTGPFRFYFQDGKTYSEGNYTNNLFDGDWTYYFRNGIKMTRINFDQPNKTFTVQEAYDSTGKALIKNGSGDFNLPFYDLLSRTYYRITGEMNKGKRSGIWDYHQFYQGKEVKRISEKYADGKVKKTSYYSFMGMLMRTDEGDKHVIETGDFEKFRIVDNFKGDPAIFGYIEGIEEKDAVKNFLFDKTPVLIDAKGDSIHQSFNIILGKLNTFSLLKNFNDQYKDYRMSFSFHISDSGTLRDIEAEGNFTDREKGMAINILEKFRNVQPIMIENVEIDRMHTIYFYSIHVAEMLPKRLQDGADSRMLIFTMIPREKLVAKLKKDFKLNLRTNEQFLHFINSNLRWQLRD